MKLYSVNCKGPLTNDEWSIVTIHRSLKGAKGAIKRYIENNENNSNKNCEYIIYVIDTDEESDVIYDCDKIDSDDDWDQSIY